ncbi:MAG TPA: hypothetical protein VHG72_19085 [Polyangia bacterium]|nr:hypothetical protein [Polyangia bacterium]
MLGVCLVSVSAKAAETDTGDNTSTAAPERPQAEAPPTATPPEEEQDKPIQPRHPRTEPPPAEPPTAQPTSPTDTSGDLPVPPPGGWHTEFSGYFRAPIALGISSRPGPDNATGPSSTQVSYGPNRTIDANYYSFAYTRLQEQDWAEFFIHEKKKHVDAAIGWMGYWYQAAGFRNPDAAWAPGMAYLSIDNDFQVGEQTANIDLTVGSWWPKFGYFEKYDTYTLGRFRQIGTQLKLILPFASDLAATLTGGFGTNRDGSFNYLAPPFYGAIVGLDLLTWWNLQFIYNRYFDVSLHYNTEWTRDPNLEQQSDPGSKSYMAAVAAHLTVAGMEANVNVPYFGHLWISPSIISVRNGWALASAGTEVMHSLGGAGIATNYMAYTGSPSDSTGSGSMVNFGFLYENSLSGIQGRPRGTLPDVTVSIFGLYAGSSITLPATTTLTQSTIKQFKYGADATLQTLSWLGFMIRGDIVNYDLDNPGFVFASLTGRMIVASNLLSSERIYLQYSRYKYGDKMVLNGNWPWGQSLIAGSSVTQEGPYSGMTPDKNVIKIQAEIAF